MLGRTRLLVTGFGPFPRMPRNPSAALALEVAASPRLRLLGIEASGFVLTTAYGTLAAELDPLLATKPDLVLMVGVAGRAKEVRIETRATSRRSILFPDACGEMPGRPEAVRDADRAGIRRASVNVPRGLAALRGHGLPARASRDAGRYLCNAVYFRALATGGSTIFIHVPKTPGLQPRNRGGSGRGSGRLVGAAFRAALVRALVDIAIDMARETRCVAPGAGFR